MNSNGALAVLCGISLGLGLWSLVALAPRIGRPRLVERIAPHILDVSDEARQIVDRRTVHPLPILGQLVSPVIARLRRALTAVLGGNEQIRQRLHQSGSSMSVDQFRTEQVVSAAVGFALGALCAVFLPAAGGLPVIVRIVLPVLGAGVGIAVRDAILQQRAKRRLARIESELPTVLEFLALSLSAGEGILDAIRRVGRTGTGELAAEFSQAARDIAAGVSTSRALEMMSESLELPALRRCIDQVVGALDRGSPLGDVLHAQAHDVRAESKRLLLETAGRKEVAMLVPLVFLILPTTICFAIFPGVFVLQAGF